MKGLTSASLIPMLMKSGGLGKNTTNRFGQHKMPMRPYFFCISGSNQQVKDSK